MLKAHKFVDLYLGTSEGLMSGVPGSLDPVPVPADPEVAGELRELRQLCERQTSESKGEFVVQHAGVTYRVSRLKSLTQVVFVLRRLADRVPTLQELSFSERLVDQWMTPNLRGLVLVSGPHSQGKTTTASSIVASRLARYGGVAITIEDPPELPLEGRHGEGVCYQTWVQEGEFSQACRQAARWAPSIIFLDEVRDAEAAIEMLKAGINGRLVIGTLHADSVQAAVERLHAYASSVGPDVAAGLIASGLSCVIQQRLDGAERKFPRIEHLWLSDPHDETAIRATIRKRQFEQLGSFVNLQANRMLMNPRERAG